MSHTTGSFGVQSGTTQLDVYDGVSVAHYPPVLVQKNLGGWVRDSEVTENFYSKRHVPGLRAVNIVGYDRFGGNVTLGRKVSRKSKYTKESRKLGYVIRTRIADLPMHAFHYESERKQYPNDTITTQTYRVSTGELVAYESEVGLHETGFIYPVRSSDVYSAL